MSLKQGDPKNKGTFVMFKMKPREDEVPSSPRGGTAPRTASGPVAVRNAGRTPGSEESAPLMGKRESSKKGRKAKPTEGAEDDSGCWNDCLRSHCGLRNRKMRNRCYLLLAILLLLLAALGGIGYLIDQAVTSSDDSSSSSSGDDDDNCRHHCDDDDDDDSKRDNDDDDDDDDSRHAIYSDDDGKRDTDKESHGADYLPSGGKSTDDQADAGFGARKLRGSESWNAR